MRHSRTFIQRHREHGLTIIEFAFILPIVLGIVLSAGYFYSYFRSFAAVHHAAETGARIAAGASVTSPDLSKEFLVWDSSSADSLIRPDLEWKEDSCRALNEPAAISACTALALSEKRTVATLWSDYTAGTSDPEFGKVLRLPYPLFERGSTPGFEPVHLLPIIGIERGCFEPANETDSRIAPLPTGRSYSPAAEGCTHVRPLYWQSAQRADFDGDRKEDIVFFRPHGTGTGWGGSNASSDADFIVYLSGMGFNQVSGILFFNLTTTQSPAPLPVVADYDRDGVSDFGVFEPATGIYRIAFSRANFRAIGEGALPFADTTGELALIAIPGTYSTPKEMELAVIPFAGDAPGGAIERFSQYTANITGSFSLSDLVDAQESGDVLTLPTLQPGTTSARMKPHPGTVSVPAFADYDDDGITETGYLSWYGGNLSAPVAGKVLSIEQSALSASTLPLFETTDTPAINAGQAPEGPKNVRMNPFALTFDDSGNLYYTDAVDHRLWKISADQASGGSFSGSSVSTVMPSHAQIASRPEPPANAPAQSFPRENVWNLVADDTRSLVDALPEEDAQSAGGRSLRYPKKIAIARKFDDALYIADWGNGRIVRVDADGGGDISSSGESRIVIGSQSCSSGGSCLPLNHWNGQGTPTFSRWEDTATNTSLGHGGRFQIWPSALAIVPDPDNAARYFLAFSSEYSVYLITPAPSRSSGGPRGETGEQIFTLSGAGIPGFPSTPTADFRVPAFSLAGGYTLAVAQSVPHCPVIDMTYDASRGSGALLSASSCSLSTTPGSSPVTERNSGGVFAIQSDSSDLRGTNALSAVAGSFLIDPCVNEKRCSEPDADGSGVYQRRVDLMRDAREIDLINPVAIELGPLINNRHSLYVLDQWNDAPQSDSTRYPLAPNQIDYQYQNAIIQVDPHTHTVTALTSPFGPGGSNIPIESVDWYSPYTTGGVFRQHIRSHLAPVKNTSVPASAGLAIPPDQGYLYVSAPPLASPAGLAADHPYAHSPKRLGVISKISLDADGDGTPDAQDADIDGDGVSNDAENGLRSALCGEIYGSAVQGGCRAQERAGLPHWFFTRADNAELQLGNGGEATYAEFALLNSVSECGAQCANGEHSRPEVWAPLFHFGDEQDFEASGGACVSESSDPASPYSSCRETANGPIAVPQTLHTFVGDDQTPNHPSYPGDGFFRRIHSSTDSVLVPDSNLFLFPAILSSKMPRENGIKPVRRIPLDLTKSSAGVRKSGILGWDYQAEEYGGSDSKAALACAFGLDFDDNYLPTYHYSGFEGTSDSQSDNDSQNYQTACRTPSPVKVYPDGRAAAIEAVVLQIDHDDTALKENPLACSSASTMNGAPYWPCPIASGDPTGPENSRSFTFLDLDGDGVSNPVWLDPSPLLAPGRSLLTGGSYLLAAGNLKTTALSNDPRTYQNMDLTRGPALFFNQILSSGPGLRDQVGLRGFFRFDGTSTLGNPLLQIGFDAGKSSFDSETQNHSHTQALFLALDLQAFSQPALQVGQVAGEDAVGAAMYANYTRNNRFRNDAAGNAPPAIEAARNLLHLAFRPGAFVDQLTDLEPGDAFVAFVNADGSSCVPTVALGKPDCFGLTVAYGLSLFGQVVTVQSTIPVTGATLLQHQEKCDPDAGSAFPCS